MTVADRQNLRRYAHQQDPKPPTKPTVADLMDWCGTHDLDPAEVRIFGGVNLMWDSPETDEEMARRHARSQAADERQRDFVRRKAEELFGVVIRPADEGGA